MKSCFFIGHREANEAILPYIMKAAGELVRLETVRDFYVGRYGGFDRIAGEAIFQLKSEFPFLRLYRVLPYHPVDRPVELPDYFNGTYYADGLESVPRRYAIFRANRAMINQVDFLIAYVWHSAINAGNLLDYARKREKKGLMGHSVNFRYKKESYKSKKSKELPREEWQIIENTHEAIVDPDTWNLAQQARRIVHRTDKTGMANPLTGLVFCADCGAKMHNHRGKLNPNRPNNGIDPKSGLYPNDCYECSSYSQSAMHAERNCFVHHISTRALYALVLETIRLTAQYAVSNQAEFIQKVREASEIKQSTAAKELKKQIAKAKKRSAELDGLIKKLYESYATGKLSESRFDMLIADYEREQAEINELIASENERLAAYEEDTGKINDFLALTKKYTDFTQLTPQLIYEFIDRIEVHKPEKVDGERTQEVEIFLKYIGKFEVPLPDPTPEEIAEAEKIRRRRANGRERARRLREKKKAAKQAAGQEAEASKETENA